MNYCELVQMRKEEQMPPGLANPSEIANGRYDCDHLSPWAKWQGSLDAEIVLVGQDWAGWCFLLNKDKIDC